MGRLKKDFALLVVALVWGVAFSSQRLAAQHLGFFTFNGLRFLTASIAILGLVRFRLRIPRDYRLWVVLAGVILFLGSAFQQAGLKYTSAANAGFITGMYVVLVPVLLSLFWRKRTGRISWLAAAVALLGVYLLSNPRHTLTLSLGDGLELISSILWALHVILVGKIAQKMDVLQFSLGQMIVAGICNILPALIFEKFTMVDLGLAAGAILYVGLVSNAFGYTLQIWAQKESHPVDAALILSMEAVFAAVFGFIILQESLLTVQIIGCILILGAIIAVSVFDVIQQNGLKRRKVRSEG